MTDEQDGKQGINLIDIENIFPDQREEEIRLSYNDFV